MAKYPALQEEVEKICMLNIRQAEQKTKEQVHLPYFLSYYKSNFIPRIWVYGIVA